MRRDGARLALVAAVASLVLTAAPRAEDHDPPGRGPVREQMRRLLAVRLKADVGLSDAQVAGVLPMIETIEAARRQAQRARHDLLGDLRRGVNGGAPDESLQGTLDALDRNEREVERETRAALDRIDTLLTVQQRVRIRFLLVRFRGEMARRVDDLRQGRPITGVPR